jgi:hypothetical protein
VVLSTRFHPKSGQILDKILAHELESRHIRCGTFEKGEFGSEFIIPETGDNISAGIGQAV